MQVVELALPGRELRVDEARGSNRVVVVAARVDLVEDTAAGRPDAAAADERCERAPVQPAAVARRRARVQGPRVAVRVVDDGRGDVLVRNDRGVVADPRPAPVGLRHLHRIRHVERRLVHVGLAVRSPVLAEEIPVVGDVDDDGVLELPCAPELVHHPADPPVELADGGERAVPVVLDSLDGVGVEAWKIADSRGLVGDIALVERRRPRERDVLERAIRGLRRGAGRALALTRMDRRSPAVRRLVGEPQEERGARMRALRQEGVRMPREDVGRVVGALAAEMARPAVVADAVVVVAGGAQIREPAVEAGGRWGLVVPAIAVQELADEPGPVTRLAQPHRKGVSRIAKGRISGIVGEDPVIVRVLAREDPGAVGTAERRGGDAIEKTGALVDDVGERVRHVGGLEAVLRLVVREHDQEVRRRRCRLDGGRRVLTRREVGEEAGRERARADQQPGHPGPGSHGPAHASKLAHRAKSAPRPC